MMAVTYTFACYAGMTTYCCLDITNLYLCRHVGMNTVLCYGELVINLARVQLPRWHACRYVLNFARV